MSTTADSLVFRPGLRASEPGVVNRVTAADAGWDLLNVELRRFVRGGTWTGSTGGHEAALVLLGGCCSVHSDQGTWPQVGRRPDVFSGMPWACYLPPETEFTLTALTDGLELAYAWVPAEEEHPARLITPKDVDIEVRGGHGATRSINSIVPPGFACQRLVCVEVYTPGGNWSSYPPHKHDEHRVDEDGKLLEADLEEVYCYKVRGPRGFSLQRVYTDDRSLDVVVTAHDDDIVRVPEGYHPVAAPYGYDCYYLNFLAGSAQSLACTDDPDYAWVKGTWSATDPRVPLVSHQLELGGQAGP